MTSSRLLARSIRAISRNSTLRGARIAIWRWPLLALLTILAAGYGSERRGKYLIGFSQANLGEPWRVAMNAEVAARAKGRDGKMKFIGIDGLPGLDGGRQAVADGKLSATFVYPTGGKDAVEIAEKILRGEKVDHRITLPTERIVK